MRLSMVVAALAIAACEGKSAPKSKTPEPTPTPVPAAATCKDDGDCVISCVGKGGCCMAPCCETAILASEANAISDYNAAHCPKDPQCPTVGGCPQINIVRPKCQAGKCVADVRPRPPTFGIAPCKADADCLVIDMDPCGGCGCRDTPIVKAEEARANAYLSSVKCDPTEKNAIVDCKCPSVKPACDKGVCVAQ